MWFMQIRLFLCVQLSDIPCLKSNGSLKSGVHLRVYALRVLYLIFCSKVYVQVYKNKCRLLLRPLLPRMEH
ncbi:hypothetical protein Tco_1177209, partial [Tanacetum coccineum]